MPDTPTINLCPTCGTRLSEDATRCLVCGADLAKPQKSDQSVKAMQASSMPQITLSLPVAILLFALFLAIGAILVFVALRAKGGEGSNPGDLLVPATETVTPSLTPTVSRTPTVAPPTPTDTPAPTLTPQTYVVKDGDSCLGIAALFSVSVPSIVTANELSASCVIYPGKELKIPHPTATITPPPSVTPNEATQTRIACISTDYKVQSGDTLGTIATNYNVSPEAIKRWNGLASDVVFEGTTLTIPLCEQPPTPGASPTPTLPPPYPAPNLLLPADGTAFTLNDNSINLQWAAVGTLGTNEGYLIKVEDITNSKVIPLEEFVTDTKFSLPSSFRPKDGVVHIFRWTVTTARQAGNDKEGRPIYVSAGDASVPRHFSWTGSDAAAATPTPQ
ncbi:MAG: LysM peptidoglycan-binding domain-containing protein [Chloroflexota bacterium]